MKHTKKRAIFTAVSMLLVSAIALSSATYAWFSAGTTVAVASLSASISNNDGSLLISAEDPSENDWKTTLGADDIINSATANNVIPSDDTFVPVSIEWSLSSITPRAGLIETLDVSPYTRTIKSTGAASGGYLKYTVWVKATVATNIKITPSFSNGAGVFIYGGVALGAQKVLLGSTGREYWPLSQTFTQCQDSNPNDILDTLDTGFASTMLGDKQEVPAVSTITTTNQLAAGVPTAIYVYMWAEGQDPACAGPISTQAGTISLLIEKAT